MGSEHYCLRWNNHQSNLLGVFSQLLESESLVDVTLACTEGPSIRAHKVVLSACSSYFQALFLDHPNRHPIVILKDVRFAELRTLVDFMYKGEVNVEYCQLSALLKTAESLKVKGLADMTNINAQAQAVVDNSPDDDPTPASAAAAHPPAVSPPSLQPTAAALATSTAASNTVNSNSNPNNPSSNAAQQPHPTAVTNSNGHANSSASNTSYTTTTATTTTTSTTTNTNNSSSNANAVSPATAQQQQQQQEPMQQDHEIEPQQRSLHRRSSRERDSRNHDRDKERAHSPRDQQQLQDNADHSADEVDVSDSPAASPPTTREASPGPLALDRPRSRRDSDSPSSCNPAGGGGDDTTRGSLSPLSVHSGPSDMSLSNNTGGRATPHAHGPSLPQSRLPSPHSTEPLAGPSGLPPVQQVPLSLKKEVDWERTEERSASSEMSSDYRLPPDPELMGMDERVFACMYCGASFLHQSKLTRHILSHSLESLKYREQAAAHLQLQAQLGLEAAASGLHLAASAEAAAVAAAAAAGHYGSPVAAGVVGGPGGAVAVGVGACEPMELDSLASAVHSEPGSGVVLCKFCGKSFPDVGSLISHLPAHTGDRPFKCEFCGKAFKLRHHMKDHCRVHTGERPFRCSLCGKTFSRSTILKAHEKTHYPKYVRKFLSPSPVDHPPADEESAAATHAAVAAAQAAQQAGSPPAQPNPHANPHAHH